LCWSTQILSLFTKFQPLVFQLRQKENFPVLECENGFWELRLGILGAMSSWLPLLAFTKFVELRFTVLISLDVLLDIKFCFKCRKETLWFHLEHLRYKILTPDSAFISTFLNFLWLKFGVYTSILKKLSLNLVILFTDKILSLNFFHLEWINSIILALVHECIPRIKINPVLSIDVP